MRLDGRGGAGDPLAWVETGSPRARASPLSRGQASGDRAAEVPVAPIGRADGARRGEKAGRIAVGIAVVGIAVVGIAVVGVLVGVGVFFTAAVGCTGGHCGGCGQPLGAAGHLVGAAEPEPAGAHQPTGSIRAVLGRTGPIGRRPAAAGPEGTSAAAGEVAAGWITGVLGISRSTTGGSSRRTGAGVSAAPHARYSPLSPAPHRAIRRSMRRSRCTGGAASGAEGAGTRVAIAVRQARCSPSAPAPHIAARRIMRAIRAAARERSGSPPTGAAGTGAWDMSQ